jgi:hypothetical protein
MSIKSLDNPIYVNTKKKLDEVGCGMCLAKWTQVTIHLQTGHTHSCHHPKTHKIPLTELKRDPSALHNTQYKKLRRKEMLEGKRPKECDYCWNIEDNSDRFSDRIFKSAESWSEPHYEEIKNSYWRDNFNPKYVEVAFSNVCNQKCSYCAPAFSSTWMEEIQKHGAYPTTDKFNSLDYNKQEDKMPIPHRDYNPYVEAFWKWWPDLYHDLHTFRITGGEPLLCKDTFKVLDYIIDNPTPNKKLNLAINSNLTVPDDLIDKFIEKVRRIEDEDRVNEFIIFTSCDTWGEQAEYLRYGMEFDRFWNNVHKILSKCNRVNLTFMSTYNALSVPLYWKLIDGIYDLKKEYGSTDRYWKSAVFLDSSYLRFPTHQTVQVLPIEWSNVIFKQIQQMDFLGVPLFESKYIGYSDIEIQKVKRIYDWSESTDQNSLGIKEQRYNFGKFFQEHDRRRGTDFKKTFPELADFYEETLRIKL